MGTDLRRDDENPLKNIVMMTLKTILSALILLVVMSEEHDGERYVGRVRGNEIPSKFFRDRKH